MSIYTQIKQFRNINIDNQIKQKEANKGTSNNNLNFSPISPSSPLSQKENSINKMLNNSLGGTFYKAQNENK